jgi:hypothetical protein
LEIKGVVSVIGTTFFARVSVSGLNPIIQKMLSIRWTRFLFKIEGHLFSLKGICKIRSTFNIIDISDKKRIRHIMRIMREMNATLSAWVSIPEIIDQMNNLKGLGYHTTHLFEE